MSAFSLTVHNRLIFLVLALLAFLADQASKQPFLVHWELGQSQSVLPFLAFTYVKNTGGLFGLFQGNAFVLGLTSLAIAVGIAFYAWRQGAQTLAHAVALGFLLGGALGNMLDRLRLGFVVDFLDLQFQGRNIWPVFNIADMAINIAIGLMILLMLKESMSAPVKQEQPEPSVEP